MRNICLSIFLIISCFLQAQTSTATQTNIKEDNAKEKRRFKGMVIAGFNVAQVDGDRMGGYYKFGFNGGVGAFAMIKKKFSISAELLYNMKGARSQLSTSRVSSRIIQLDYAEAPIMFNYHDKKLAIFGLGFSFGGLIRQKQLTFDAFGNETGQLKLPNGSFISNENYVAGYKKYDFQFIGHVTFIIKKIIGIQGRFGYSIAPIGVGMADGNLKNSKQWNNVLSLRTMYIF